MKTFTLILPMILAVSALNLCTCQETAPFYVVVDEAVNTPGGIRFENEIGGPYGIDVLENASDLFWTFFLQTNNEDRKNFQLITLTVKEMNGGVTFTSSSNESDIYLNPSYIANYVGDVKREFTGMMFHEIARIRQWTGNGEAPIGLLTGIADYFRLQAGYESANWCKLGDGSEWYDGYDVTAKFLYYCESRYPGMVVYLNGWMRFGYTIDMFYQYTGSAVDELWYEYKSLYADRG